MPVADQKIMLQGVGHIVMGDKRCAAYSVCVAHRCPLRGVCSCAIRLLCSWHHASQVQHRLHS